MRAAPIETQLTQTPFNTLEQLRKAAFVGVCSLVLLAGCAGADDAPATGAAGSQAQVDTVNDPLEPVNRAILEFNQVVDHFVLKPALLTYQIVPPPIRDGVHNALLNLKAPVVFANDLLQGQGGRAGNTAARFAINSTLGLLGIWDPAEIWFGIPAHTEEFGQTLASWGIGEGPFLMLPIVGPSNPRDAVGMAVDSAADPFNWYARNIDEDAFIYTRLALTVLDTRDEVGTSLDALERNSLDFYASLRTIYRQRRADEIKNRPTTQKPSAPSISMAAKPDESVETKPAAR